MVCSLVAQHTAYELTARQNSLYNSALRQGSSIRRDLDSLAEGIQSSPALLGTPPIVIRDPIRPRF
jgi:hypothetical protein